MPHQISEELIFKEMTELPTLQEEFVGVVARVESLWGRMSEVERQVEGLFESLLADAFQ